jgi:cyclin-dependent kinase 7
MESPCVVKPVKPQTFSPAASIKVSSPGSAKSASPAAHYERIESKIGEGTYGKIHKAKDVRTGQIVAIKKSKVSATDLEVGGISFTVLREIKLMQAVRHPNVMSCIDVFADGGVLHLVMEFMDGDLNKIIEDRRMAIDEAHVKCLSSQVLKGLAALHRQWFLHRDVTPTNVLLSHRSGVAKLTDFGMARSINHRERPLTPMCTTPWYRAPELLYGAKFYGPSVDMWSAGCVVAELFFRKALFQGRGEFDMLAKIFEKRGTPTQEAWGDASALPNFVEFSQHPEVPFSVLLPAASTAAHSILQALLSLNPKGRPSAEGALQHEFFASALPVACEPRELPFVRPAATGE